MVTRGLCTKRFGVALAMLCGLALSGEAEAQTRGRKRAVLVGINDYTASKPGARPRPTQAPLRDWPNLGGTLNDVAALEEMLLALHGFERRDIVTLTDQAATRAAILRTLDQHLLLPAAKGDVLLFYFAGHGSQVRNSRSSEADKLDESIVPADSRSGAADIRDKELRPLFNRMLDRGARLTVILDNCHSGSGARGLPTGARPRGIQASLRDVADGKDGPRPEDRGALVLSASEDDEPAWETTGEDGKRHGAFSWALLRALRDSSPGEAASETFLRARARMRAETPFQTPVMAGLPQSRLAPFLGTRTDRREGRTVVGIERVRDDGTILLNGGWANGLSVGSELRFVGEPRITVRLTVTAVHGLTRSEARITPTSRAKPQAVRAGALMEVVGWLAPAGRPMRVWAPRVPKSAAEVMAFARTVSTSATRRGVRFVSDPTDVTATHVLRPADSSWELLGPDHHVERLSSEADAIAAVAKIAPGSSLFVQLPAPAALIEGIAIAPGSDSAGIEIATRAEDADYVLTGRYAARRLQYAWVRPAVRQSDRRSSGLPVRTSWTRADGDDGLRDSIAILREGVLRLRKIRAWHLLESPPDSAWSYRLAVRREDGDLANDATLTGEEKYGLSLRSASTPPPPHVQQRSVYAFVIDSHGKSVLLFPRGGVGSIENRFPLTPQAGRPSVYPPVEISLGMDGTFHVAPPYGVDTYFLLTTDEPLPNPWILEWEGVRAGTPRPETALETLLMLVLAGDRSRRVLTPSTWSLERAVFESVAPRPAAKRR